MHPQRADIDADLLAGRSLREVARRYSLSKDAAHRHIEHIDAQQRAEVREQSNMSATSIAGRIRSIADDAKATRVALQGRGEYRAALRASEVELRTLDVLATRLGIDDLDVLASMEASTVALTALGNVLIRRPEIVPEVADTLRREGHVESADELVAFVANLRQTYLQNNPATALQSEEASP